MPLVRTLISTHFQIISFSSGDTIGDSRFDGFSKLLLNELPNRYLTFNITHSISMRGPAIMSLDNGD